MTWHNLAGSTGAILIVASYFLLQLEKLEAQSCFYSLINFLGAGCILISLYFEFNLSAFIVESFWLLASVYGMSKAMLKKVRHTMPE